MFLSHLIFEDDGGFPYVLYAPLIYRSAILGRDLEVPKGFTTDLASIPRGLWNIIPKSGKYDAAAVVHDFLYHTHQTDRATADAVLKEAMASLGVGAIMRNLIYAAVRVGGAGPWNAASSPS